MKIRLTTRDAILESAFQLYKETPTASLADIAEHAGIGRATLHRHFSSRNDLLIELARVAIVELDTAAETAAADAKSYTEALMLVMREIIPLADRQWFLSNEAVENNPAILKEYKRQSREMDDLIEQAKKEGGFDKAIPTIWIRQSFDGLLFVAWEMIRNGNATVNQASELAWNTLLKGTGPK